jgi:hypothetical protein
MAVFAAGMEGGPKTISLDPHATSPAAAAKVSNTVCGLNCCHFFVRCISINLKVMSHSFSYKF